MNTQTFIKMLAAQAEPVPKHLIATSVTWPLVVGLILSVGMSVGTIGMLPFAELIRPIVMSKFLYGGVFASTVLVLLLRLLKPGVPIGQVKRLPGGVMLIMLVVGLIYLILQPQDQWQQEILGKTWLICPWFVLGLSLPTLFGLFVAARQLAVTDARSTGFALGLIAGAVGALGYSFACPEISLAFVAIWYTAGILLSGFVGRALGPRLLSW